MHFFDVTINFTCSSHCSSFKDNNSVNTGTATKLASLKTRDLQKLIGRKLTLKEKIGLLILKYTPNKKTQSKGSTALGFGIAGLAFLILGLFVPYVIIGALIASILAIVLGSNAKRRDSSDAKARAAVLLGWITLGAIALLLILVAVVIAAYGIY